MTDAALRESLAAYDDTALATLTNPGLVRRAHRDVDEGKVRLVGGSPGKAEVDADGHLVLLDARGPAAAQCACKSVAVCRHRIAAVLFVLTQAAGDAAPEEAGEPGAASTDPQELLSAFDLAALARWAGKASWRAALETTGDPTTVTVQSNAIAVELQGLEAPVLILRGQGFDGIISKAPKAQRKALHAAAVLGARRHFGLAVPDAQPEADAPTDTACAYVPDPAFLNGIACQLAEVAALGFNLAPVPLEESLFEMSVSTRADALPRLAALLRAIAAQIRLRRKRALSFDSDVLLELTATAFALTYALGRGNQERQAALVGQLRRSFEPAAPLNLIGCGGERWRTPTGARGVTAWFVEAETGRWLSTSLARGPGQDPQFMPGEAWRHQAMWQAEPLATLAHARLTLEGANISADGRLSAPAAARASIIETKALPPTDLLGIVRNWAELRAVHKAQTGLGLDAARGPVACLIAPVQTAAPWFDDFAQQLVWPVCDETGAWLALTLDHDESATTALEALEANLTHGWRGLVLVRISRGRQGLAVTPITLIGNEAMIDLTMWQEPRTWTGRLQQQSWLTRLRQHRPGNRIFTRLPRDGTQAALDAVWQHLIDRLEAGSGLAAMLDGARAAHADRLDAFGLPVLATLLRKADGAEGTLTAAYALLITREQRSSLPLLG
ncbi:hypothetical protein [Novosphingobium sp. SG707]|uniref:hypothetical protein n=1 Tax=Novosphingobium sp. SG707 TaxID=2586996 RepID=UPI00144566CF|nr:hypothetical protein [Novosphingobium sp. SG707]NKJ00406.1 hypothetical protein [Novosphingobium sp. SG707]